MWPFDGLFPPLVDFSPWYNLILGAILIFAGLIGFKYIPGKIGTLIALGLLGVGLAVATGYLVIL
jgi:hypothetical protein